MQTLACNLVVARMRALLALSLDVANCAMPSKEMRHLRSSLGILRLPHRYTSDHGRHWRSVTNAEDIHEFVSVLNLQGGEGHGDVLLG